MQAKRRIHKFNFDQTKMLNGDLTHVALVDSAANLTEALTMKATVIETDQRTKETYGDNGSYEYKTDSITIHDYGEDEILVETNSKTFSSFYVQVR